MKNTWNEALKLAKPIVDFLSSPDFFSTPYNGETEKFEVLTDSEEIVGIIGKQWDSWEEIIEQPFDDSFEWHYLFGSKLIDSNCLGALDKNFHGADGKLTYQNVTNLIHEIFFRDMEILLNCYANNFVPEIWKDILYVYQHNGLPCGWQGDYPKGKMIIFSNE